MMARLLHSDGPFDWAAAPAWNDSALTLDLALDALFYAMASGDELILNSARRVVLASPANDLETIQHRQGVLVDCFDHPQVARQLYALALDAAEFERKHYYYLNTLNRYPEWVLSRSVDLMADLIALLRRLRAIADRSGGGFVSTGWTNFFARARMELSDQFFVSAERHLGDLRLRHGLLLSAGLGKANKAARYVLHQPPRPNRLQWWRRWLARIWPPPPPPNSFEINPRDESGIRALDDIRRHGIAVVANALAKSSDDISGFFKELAAELGFYVGCLNLRDALIARGQPTCVPTVSAAAGAPRLSFRSLFDVGLALTSKSHVVGNDADLDGAKLVLVTGANQGGKSTFLRSIGVAQLLSQAGMFAPAQAFQTSLCDGVLTHYKREEDTMLEAGKFDEELQRMSEIIYHLTGRPLLLFNESFAATNEREGSEIARQVLSALLEGESRMICVTHLYKLARGFYDERRLDVRFLRAERREGGDRTFKLLNDGPLRTSFGADLYREIFGSDLERVA